MGKLGDYVPTAADVEYIEAAHPELAPGLAELETRGRRDGISIVDRAAGRVLAVLASDRRAILEIGTAYGYSTLWMALAMPADGRIVTIDPDRARTDVARGYWRAAGVPDERIVVVNQPALEALGTARPDGDPLSGPFDLVFLDAIKEEYTAYLEAALPRCRAGAIVVADNVLWSGYVAGAPYLTSKARSGSSTEALRAFNLHALSHARLATTILPVGDGLLFGVVRG